jgi:hypothetical protein
MNRVEERAASMGEEEGFIPRQNLTEYVSEEGDQQLNKLTLGSTVTNADSGSSVKSASSRICC